MKKTLLVLALLSSVGVGQGEEVPAPKSFLDGIYIESLGVMRKPNMTGKSEWGAGAELGLALNKHVAIGVQNLAYQSPDNWGGSVIDETAGVAHWTLLTAANKKTSLEGLGSVTHSWRSDSWAIGTGVGIKHSFTERVSAGVGATVRFWNNGNEKEDLLVFGSLGFRF